LTAFARPEVIAVLTQERTASQSVFHGLRAAARDAEVIHAHFLDGTRYRPASPDPEEAERQKAKAEKEARLRALLDDQSKARAVVTVVREPAGRIISCLWYAKHADIIRFYDAGSDSFDPAVGKVIDKRLAILRDKQTSYAREVFEALGLPTGLRPGRYRTAAGAEVLALDFSDLEREFERATRELLGEPVALPRINTGDSIGQAEGYTAFRRYCQEALTPERMGLTPTA
jgi:hypothetical protein